MSINRFAWVLAVAAGFVLLHPAGAQAADKTKRNVVINNFDTDGDHAFKKKEMKAFAAAKPNMHAQLMSFCDQATSAPGRFDVRFPPGKKAKKFKCKKNRVDRPYLMAWARRGAPIPEDHP